LLTCVIVSDCGTSIFQASALLHYFRSAPNVLERLANRLPTLSALERKMQMASDTRRFDTVMEKYMPKYQILYKNQEQGNKATDQDPLAVELETMVQNAEQKEGEEHSSSGNTSRI
jgi:hypothetical protein